MFLKFKRPEKPRTRLDFKALRIIVETLKKLNNLFLKTLRLMQKMVPIACLKKRSNQMIQVMLHLTRNKFFICSQNIFVSILSLLNVMESGLLDRYSRMLYMRCINSVISKVLEKYGATYGHAGIHLKCGGFGHDLHLQCFQDLEQL